MKLFYKITFVSLTICLLMSGSANAQNSGLPVESADFRVFPNPAQSEDAYVSLRGFKAENLLVVVYDMLGREIYSKVEMKESEGFLFTISSNGNRLPSGVYLITAAANDKVFREKLIVR